MEQRIITAVLNSDSRKTWYMVALSAFCAIVPEITLGTFSRNPLAHPMGRIAAIFLTLFALHRFALVAFRSYRPRLRDLITFGVLFTMSCFIASIGKVLSISLANYLGNINPSTMELAIPYATGPILMQAVLGVQFGFIFVITLAVVLSFYISSDLVLFTYIVSTSLMACLSMTRFRTRSAYIKAGMSVSLISVPLVLSIVLLQGGSNSGSEVLLMLASGLIGGVVCSFLVAGLAPVLEYLGSYVTDISLLEIATLDHPLLKELSIQSPGTWNHSMVMGMMVESAADSIGANSVLARVGAYYHDIGKIKKAMYFVENQSRGENRHDKLSPSMSALIIRSHVKDGIELARKHNIPQVIEDMIPQHHGTSLIEYFYDKAIKDAQEAGVEEQVDETLYRYPGPKPQTKEAGILMLADGVEAASRTLVDPSPDRIQGLVQKMINKVFSSGELNECELTLKDLHAIAKCFTRVLSGIHHQRIAYSEPAEKSRDEEKLNESEAGKENQGSNHEKKGRTEAENRRGQENHKEDLKRLGL